MTDSPALDPYEVLGVGLDADAIVIQLAYRARIREVHPDRAGSAGLEAAKRLNMARDWLLDPVLRAQLGRSPGPAAQADGARTDARGRPATSARPRRRRSTGARQRPSILDPYGFDFGPHTDELRAFFEGIGSLSRDERARVNYSLGDARPVVFEDYRDYLPPQLWTRSRALRDVVSLLWEAGVDEEAPSPLGRDVPTGLLVANAYAQWVLLGDLFRRELGDAVFRSEHVIESFALRCTGPWEASVRQPRYGPYGDHVMAFFATANRLSMRAADRLARSWVQNMGRDGLGDRSSHIGPGVWLPAPSSYPEVLKVSGYLAAVDATRIEPPAGLEGQHHHGFRYGLRLTAHVLALGLVSGPGRDYLQPWRDAVAPDRSLLGRLRWLMPTG